MLDALLEMPRFRANPRPTMVPQLSDHVPTTTPATVWLRHALQNPFPNS